jgi:hypothetical protein
MICYDVVYSASNVCSPCIILVMLFSYSLILTTSLVDSGVIVPNCFHSCPLLVVYTSSALPRWTVSRFLCHLLLLWTDITRVLDPDVYVLILHNPDDESIDLKHVEKCEECKHLGTRTKIVVRIEGQDKYNLINNEPQRNTCFWLAGTWTLLHRRNLGIEFYSLTTIYSSVYRVVVIKLRHIVLFNS